MKIGRLVAVLVLGLAGLTGCQGAAPQAAERTDGSTLVGGTVVGVGSPADGAVLDSIDWVDNADGPPTLEFTTPLAVADVAVRVVDPGQGETVSEGMLLWLGFVLYGGTSGQLLGSNFADQLPFVMILKQSATEPALHQAMTGLKTGAKLIVARSGDPEATSLEETESSFMGIEILQVSPGRAWGDPVTPPAGLPVVTLNDDGSPNVKIPDADPPTGLVAQTLIEGPGPAVAFTQTAIVQFTGWLWDDGSVFGTSWETGSPVAATILPAELNGDLIAGWVEGLEDKTVGSQVLLVIPPELAFGPQGMDPVPGGATVVYVVDILGLI